MVIIREFWTDGNLIINNTGGINYRTLETSKWWYLDFHRGIIVLYKEIKGTNYQLIAIRLSAHNLHELQAFFMENKVPYLNNYDDSHKKLYMDKHFSKLDMESQWQVIRENSNV